MLVGPDGTSGLVASMAELAGSMDRLAKNLTRVLDILIPPDGTKGVVARLEDIETAREDAREWRKWFYRAVGATIITAIIGIMVVFIR